MVCQNSPLNDNILLMHKLYFIFLTPQLATYHSKIILYVDFSQSEVISSLGTDYLPDMFLSFTMPNGFILDEVARVGLQTGVSTSV